MCYITSYLTLHFKWLISWMLKTSCLKFFKLDDVLQVKQITQVWIFFFFLPWAWTSQKSRAGKSVLFLELINIRQILNNLYGNPTIIPHRNRKRLNTLIIRRLNKICKKNIFGALKIGNRKPETKKRLVNSARNCKFLMVTIS